MRPPYGSHYPGLIKSTTPSLSWDTHSLRYTHIHTNTIFNLTHLLQATNHRYFSSLCVLFRHTLAHFLRLQLFAFERKIKRGTNDRRGEERRSLQIPKRKVIATEGYNSSIIAVGSLIKNSVSRRLWVFRASV